MQYGGAGGIMIEAKEAYCEKCYWKIEEEMLQALEEEDEIDEQEES